MKRIASLCIVLATSLAALAQYTIYPMPRSMTAMEGTAQFSQNVCLVADEGIDAATIERAQQILKEHGLNAKLQGQQQCTSVIYLRVDPSQAVANKHDAHTINLEAQGDGMAKLTITGQHTDAVFYALASLEQMLDEKGTVALPCVNIKDYADQAQRGIVEGYYGYPYSVEVKKDLMRFMMRMKMNTYLYGAKSDPYHSQNWKEPYPVSVSEEEKQGGWMSQDMVRDVCQESQRTKVNFIWAIHPGNNFLGSSTVINDIMTKFRSMHGLGVRQFAVFVDDVSVPSSEADLKLNATRLTELQKQIEKTFNTSSAAAIDTVKPLHFVPQIYCRSFASSEDQFRNFFKALAATPKHIVIYTTGWGVWSVPNVSDYNNTAQWLGREVAWWWNYPCNDNADAQIYTMDMYQNFVDMPAVNGSSTLPADMQNRGMGIVSNPMQQGEVAKTALFSVADYAWNAKGFNNKKSWEASFNYVLKDEILRNAYRTLAPYLTYNDPTTGVTATLTTAVADKRIEPLLEACETLATMESSGNESERLLYHDLKPWLLKLKTMLATAQNLYHVKSMKNTVDDALNTEKWDAYLQCLNAMDDIDNSEDYIVRTLEGMNYKNVGSHRVKPAQKVLAASITALNNAAMKNYVPARPTAPTPITNTTYAPKITASTAAPSTYYINLTAKTYQPKDYVGLTLPETRYITIAAADSLLQSGREIWVSGNGKDWTTLQAGQQPTERVRHLIVVNTSQVPHTTRYAEKVLSIQVEQDPTISSVTTPAGDVWKDGPLANLTDGNYATVFAMNANQKTGDSYTLNLSKEAPIERVRIVIGTTNDDYMNTGRIEISTDNKSWTRLSPIGQTKTTFTIDDMKPLSTDSKILDFNGKGKRASYIRLYNVSPKTNKWLRIFEIEPSYAVAQADVENSQGQALKALYDGQLTTGETPEGDHILIRLPQTEDLEDIVLLTSQGVECIDMSQTPRAAEYSFTWKGEAPRIYEIFANTLGSYDILGVESIAPLSAPAPHSHNSYDLQGRLLQRPLAHGISIEGGHLIIRK